jgi:hypothetical protein
MEYPQWLAVNPDCTSSDNKSENEWMPSAMSAPELPTTPAIILKIANKKSTIAPTMVTF